MSDDCKCEKCISDRGDTWGNGIPLIGSIMILCQICGNKRCPHATDHNNPCTNSNAPGQKGSSYENCT